jgi:hypothetical protein
MAGKLQVLRRQLAYLMATGLLSGCGDSSYAAGDSSTITTDDHIGKHAALGPACLLAKRCRARWRLLEFHSALTAGIQRPNSVAQVGL